jgi:hypothetical protein
VNNGLLHKSGGAGITNSINVEFRNNGETRVATGSLTIPSDSTGGSDTGTYTTAAGATLSLQGPRTLAVGSSVTGAGTVSLSGDIRVDGAGITAGQLVLSDLAIGFRGVTAGSQYPVFQSTGLTTFNGSVVLRAEPGWCPKDGDSLTPFRWGSRSGTPWLRVLDVEFGATSAWLADRLRIDISNVSCDVVAPTMAGYGIDSPTQADPLLRRRMTTQASDDRAVTEFEYVWRSGSWAGTQTPGSGPVSTFYPSYPWVSFANASPSQNFTLFVRAVDRKLNKSPWTSQTFTTPAKPTLVALGDSVAAGHNAANGTKECKDINFGYPRYVFENMQNSLPGAWRETGWLGTANAIYYDQYRNLAYSGFSSDQVIAGGEQCGLQVTSPLDRAVSLLSHPTDLRSRSWNTVVMTVGANNTNWSDTSIIGGGPMLPTIIGNFKTLSFNCAPGTQSWNGFDPAVVANLKSDQTSIYQSLIAADSSVRILRTGYYNMGGTGPLNFLGGCTSALQPMVDQLTATAFDKSGLTTAQQSNVFNLPIESLLDFRDDRIQGFSFSNAGSDGAWPHPDTAGHEAVATALDFTYKP